MSLVPDTGQVVEWRVHKPPARATRKRFVCQAIASGEGDGARASNAYGSRGASRGASRAGRNSRTRTSPEPCLHQNEQSSKQAPAMPLRVVVRVMYYSNDGEPADNGDVLELDVSTSTTVEALLQKAREAANLSKGKLMWRMRPLKDMEASLESCGVLKGPKDLQLMLKRKERPAAVAERAEQEAKQLAAAMVIAKQEAADAGRAIPKKQRQALEAAAATAAQQERELEQEQATASGASRPTSARSLSSL